MLVLAIVLLFLLAIVNFFIGKRVLVYPPFVYCSVWAVALLVIWIAGDFYYPLSTKTLWVFISGACAFSLGAIIALVLPMGNLPKGTMFSKVSNRLLTTLVLVVIAAAPFAVLWIIRALSANPTANFLASAREALFVEEQGLGPILVQNLLILAVAVAIAAFREKEMGKARSFVAILVALVLTFLTGARSSFVPLILSLLCLDWMKNHKVRWKLFSVLTVVLLILSSATAIFLGKAGADRNASLTQNITPVFEGFVLYGTAPLVAYDQAVRSPNIVPHFMGVSGLATHLLYRIDPTFRPPLVDIDWLSTFVCTSPDQCGMNVFTIYFSYIDFGFMGMFGMVTLFGVVVTTVYRYASHGHSVAILMYVLMFSGVVLSVFQEYFFDYANYLLKCFVVFLFIYSLPAMVTRASAIAHRTAARIPPSIT